MILKTKLLMLALLCAVTGTNAQNLTLSQKREIMEQVDLLLKKYSDYCTFRLPGTRGYSEAVADSFLLLFGAPTMIYNDLVVDPGKDSLLPPETYLIEVQKNFPSGLNSKIIHAEYELNHITDGQIEVKVKKVSTGYKNDGKIFSDTVQLNLMFEFEEPGSSCHIMVISGIRENPPPKARWFAQAGAGLMLPGLNFSEPLPAGRQQSLAFQATASLGCSFKERIELVLTIGFTNLSASFEGNDTVRQFIEHLHSRTFEITSIANDLNQTLEMNWLSSVFAINWNLMTRARFTPVIGAGIEMNWLTAKSSQASAIYSRVGRDSVLNILLPDPGGHEAGLIETDFGFYRQKKIKSQPDLNGWGESYIAVFFSAGLCWNVSERAELFCGFKGSLGSQMNSGGYSNYNPLLAPKSESDFNGLVGGSEKYWINMGGISLAFRWYFRGTEPETGQMAWSNRK